MFKKSLFTVIKKGTVQDLETFVLSNPDSLYQNSGYWGGYTSPISYALMKQKHEHVIKLLELNDDLDIITSVCSLGRFYALRDGDIEFVSTLMEAGVEFDIFQAVKAGNVQNIELLIDKGYDLDSRGCGGWTPLYYAAYSDDHSLYKMLVDAGADQSLLTDKGETVIGGTRCKKIKELYYNQFKSNKNPYHVHGFRKENESTVVHNKLIRTENILITTVYDFEYASICTVINDQVAQSPFLESFKHAASPKQLREAAAFLEKEGGNTYNWVEQVNTQVIT